MESGNVMCLPMGIAIILYKSSNKDSDPNKGGEADNIPSSAAKLKLKSNGMTDTERVKARAERFSMSNKAVDEKKASRAQRFGISNTAEKSAKDSEVLARRAERFGMNKLKLENKEKIDKRILKYGKIEAPKHEQKTATASREKKFQRAPPRNKKFSRTPTRNKKFSGTPSRHKKFFNKNRKNKQRNNQKFRRRN